MWRRPSYRKYRTQKNNTIRINIYIPYKTKILASDTPDAGEQRMIGPLVLSEIPKQLRQFLQA